MVSTARQRNSKDGRQVTDRPKRVRIRRILLFSSGALSVILAVFIALSAVDLCVLRARVCLESRQHAAALKWLERAAWLSPDNAEANFLLARAYRRVEQFKNVEKYLARAHDLGWDQRQLEREQQIALAQDGQFKELEGQWGALLTDAGSDGPEICKAYVDYLLGRFNLNDALLILDAWELDFPTDPTPHLKRGRILEVQEQWKAAAQQYGRAVELGGGGEARYLLGKMLMRQMFFDDALRQLGMCHKDDPGNGEAAVGMAKCLNKLGRPDEARQILDTTLHTDPINIAALRERGEMELVVGDAEQAIGFLRRALEEEPVDRAVHYSLAQALQRAGRHAEAQKEFAYVNAATKPVLRLATVTPALAEDPTNVELRFEVALTTWKYKSRREGARWFLSLLEFDPYHAPTHKILEEHFTLTGDPERAKYHGTMARESLQKKAASESP